MRQARALLLGLVAACAVCAAACGGGTAAATAVDLHGAGASFPYPLYDRWFKDYVGSHPNTTVDYQSVGSGAEVDGLVGELGDAGAAAH